MFESMHRRPILEEIFAFGDTIPQSSSSFSTDKKHGLFILQALRSQHHFSTFH